MRQVTQNQKTGEVRVEQTPRPALRARGVLVQTAFSLVSAGTERSKVELARKSLLGKARARPEQVKKVLAAVRDQGIVDTYRRVTNRLAALEPLGYSCSGTVTAVGEGVPDLRVGDRVACGGGGYANHAEVNFVPRNLCARVPERSVVAEDALMEGAAFATVGAIAMQGVRQAALAIGETAAVVGLGLIGLLTVQIVKAAGCVVVGFDPDERRRRLARDLGCDAVAGSAGELAALAQQVSDGIGADAVLVTAASSGSGPVELAARVARDRGRVVVVGAVRLDLPRQPFYDKELDLRLSRSYGPGRYDPAYEEHGHDYPVGYVRWTEQRNMASFVRLVATGALRTAPLVTHRYPIADAESAYSLITRGTQPYLGVVISYAGEGEALAAPAPPEPPAVVSAPAAPRALLSPPRPLVRIALVGAGSFAQNVLLPALQADPNVRLATVVTSSGLAAASVARRFGFARSAGDPEEVFGDPEVDAVVVATRHDSHARLAAAALRAGKAVFVEKPLAIDLPQLDELAAARAAAPRGDVMVGFNRRFAPATAAVRAWMRPVPEPLVLTYRVNAGYIPRTHWVQDPAVGGGRLVGEGCHFLDLLVDLAGSAPATVSASALPDSGRYAEDNFVVRVAFANGSLGVLTYVACGSTAAGKERLEVFGGGRTAVIDDFRRAHLALGEEKTTKGGTFARQDKGHAAEVAAFLAAVRSGGPSPVPFAESVRTMQLTFAAQESIRLGRPVPLA